MLGIPEQKEGKPSQDEIESKTAGIKNKYSRKLAKDAYRIAKENGLPLPAIETTAARGSIAVAWYSQSNHKISISGKVNSKWEEKFLLSVEKNWNSQPNPVLHELAHAAHANVDSSGLDRAKNRQFTKKQLELIEKEVSRYATTNGTEFIAEAYSGKLAGKQYSDELKLLFKSVTHGKLEL